MPLRTKNLRSNESRRMTKTTTRTTRSETLTFEIFSNLPRSEAYQFEGSKRERGSPPRSQTDLYGLGSETRVSPTALFSNLYTVWGEGERERGRGDERRWERERGRRRSNCVDSVHHVIQKRSILFTGTGLYFLEGKCINSPWIIKMFAIQSLYNCLKNIAVFKNDLLILFNIFLIS